MKGDAYKGISNSQLEILKEKVEKAPNERTTQHFYDPASSGGSGHHYSVVENSKYDVAKLWVGRCDFVQMQTLVDLIPTGSETSSLVSTWVRCNRKNIDLSQLRYCLDKSDKNMQIDLLRDLAAKKPRETSDLEEICNEADISVSAFATSIHSNIDEDFIIAVESACGIKTEGMVGVAKPVAVVKKESGWRFDFLKCFRSSDKYKILPDK